MWNQIEKKNIEIKYGYIHLVLGLKSNTNIHIGAKTNMDTGPMTYHGPSSCMWMILKV